MISPHRLLSLGLSVEEVAALYGISREILEAQLAEAEARREEALTPAPAGRQLMTPLLARPDFIQSKFGKRLRA